MTDEGGPLVVSAIGALVRSIDKSGWGPGPWQDEPDFLEWQSEHPPHYWCQINRSDATGVLCGYVAVPPGHPANGTRHHECIDALDVHGGITFTESGIDGLWVIGFDCGHGFDLHPATEARLRELLPPQMYEHHKQMLEGLPGLSHVATTYKTIGFVRAEVENLALQLAAMVPLLPEGEP